MSTALVVVGTVSLHDVATGRAHWMEGGVDAYNQRRLLTLWALTVKRGLGHYVTAMSLSSSLMNSRNWSAGRSKISSIVDGSHRTRLASSAGVHTLFSTGETLKPPAPLAHASVLWRTLDFWSYRMTTP